MPRIPAAGARSWRRASTRWAGRALVGWAAATAAVLLTATQASAAGPGFYLVNGPSPGTFQVLRTGNLAHGTVDDAVFGLSTSGAGLMRLPFPIHAWNQTYQRAVISSNG